MPWRKPVIRIDSPLSKRLKDVMVAACRVAHLAVFFMFAD